MRILLALILIIFINLTITSGHKVKTAPRFKEDQYKSSFIDWTKKFGKEYDSHEFARRYNTFKDNMDYVDYWNSQNSETVLGLNLFADINNLEYQRLYLGTRATVNPHKMILDKTFTTSNPTSVDWRSKGAVTPIKDQGQCGSCWSFSTTGSVEGAHQIKTGNLVSLSEQNLMDCSLSYGNEGCNGGLMNLAFEYIIDNKGIDTESSYPYTAEDGPKCAFNSDNVGATITGYGNVTSGSETQLENAVAKYGPISVAIDASHISFQLYRSGIYYERRCSSTQLDHGVLVVGYGSGRGDEDEHTKINTKKQIRIRHNEDYGIDEIVTEDDVEIKTDQDEFNRKGKYWIVKNSWGTTWGMKGFINMAKQRNNNCGIASMASYPTID